MKKIFFLVSSLLLVILLSSCFNQEVKVEPKTREYYKDFRKKCDSSSCCLSSVNNAEQVNSFIYDGDSYSRVAMCPEGFHPTMNKCPESYVWCIPVDRK